jgi:hypothetical protein
VDEFQGELKANCFAIFGFFGNLSRCSCGSGYDLAGFINVTD